MLSTINTSRIVWSKRLVLPRISIFHTRFIRETVHTAFKKLFVVFFVFLLLRVSEATTTASGPLCLVFANCIFVNTAQFTKASKDPSLGKYCSTQRRSRLPNVLHYFVVRRRELSYSILSMRVS